jgi:hypothetical protein
LPTDAEPSSHAELGIAWLIPFIILAIITPQGLAFRAIVALIHWL